MNKFDDNSVLNLSVEEKNDFIVQYQPFILKVVSELKNGYVNSSNDEFSVALMAFDEAINKYDKEKGSFLSFARLVISSRVKSYWAKEMGENHLDIEEYLQFEKVNVNQDLKIEILALEQILQGFEISFDDLVEASPKHQKTRDNALSVGKKSSDDVEVVKFLYTKKRLPITMISLKFKTTKKVLKRNKLYITSVIIVFKEKFDEIINFIL